MPAETASTPAAHSAGVSERSLTSAPRSLNEAVNCRFSNLRYTSAPVIADSVREYRQGVSFTWPASTAAAARMDSAVTFMVMSYDMRGYRQVKDGPLPYRLALVLP